jgi:PEP-CTERM motif-containing protein
MQDAWAKGGFAKMIRSFGYAVFTVLAIVSLARAGTDNFAFSGGGITSSGTLTFVPVPDSTSGVSTPGTYEITGITGNFTDSNDGISGVITSLYTPLSYITPLTETSTIPVGFTTGGLSYDDLFFPAGNSPADCPGYPFSGGDFDILGVAFNVTGGYVGEFFSDGNFPGYSGPVYAAADANSITELDNPNPSGNLPGPTGVVGTFNATPVPEPGSLLLLAGGLVAMAIRFAGRARRS